MARDNVTWGEDRIANELLLKLEIQLSPRPCVNTCPRVQRVDSEVINAG